MACLCWCVSDGRLCQCACVGVCSGVSVLVRLSWCARVGVFVLVCSRWRVSVDAFCVGVAALVCLCRCICARVCMCARVRVCVCLCVCEPRVYPPAPGQPNCRKKNAIPFSICACHPCAPPGGGGVVISFSLEGIIVSPTTNLGLVWPSPSHFEAYLKTRGEQG